MIYTEQQLKEMMQGMTAEACCDQQSTARPITSSEQIMHDLSARAYCADVEGGKARSALDFFGKHPEFTEFIALVRSGTIQF